MPELPEVETIVRSLRPALLGQTILKADLRWPRTLAVPSEKKFKERVRGQTIQEVGRRAKFINIRLTDYNFMVHLRMSGDLSVRNGKIKAEKHDRLILSLSNGAALVFNDTRKFGRVWLTDEPEKVLGGLGPEPLSGEFTAARLFENLKKHHRLLKPLLLDQTFLAGLGNIYTDEALHMAKLHPLKDSASLNARQAERLWEAIRAVLQEGIRRSGSSIDWVYRGGDYQNHFRVYDRAGEPCPVCGTKIERLVVGQRGTHICPKCQKR